MSAEPDRRSSRCRNGVQEGVIPLILFMLAPLHVIRDNAVWMQWARNCMCPVNLRIYGMFGILLMCVWNVRYTCVVDTAWMGDTVTSTNIWQLDLQQWRSTVSCKQVKPVTATGRELEDPQILHQITTQPPWAYCEIPGYNMRIKK